MFDSFERLLDEPDAAVLVATTNGRLVGYLVVHSHRTLFANGDVGWVEELMVDTRFRRTGVGRELMKSAERWATDRGARYVALATRRAASFYETLGYELSADYYRRTFDDDDC